MSNPLILNPQELYEKAAEIAERALAVDAGQGYALQDLADRETVIAAFMSPHVGPLLVEGTLTGCLAALTHTPNAVVGPLRSSAVGPAKSDVNHDDMRHAHAILSATVGKQLDVTQRGAVVSAEIPSSYVRNFDRMSSMAIALFRLTDELVTHGRQ